MGDSGRRDAYRFGPFQLDVRERRLARGTEVIPLRLKVFDTLCVLVENAGRLVTKDELLSAIWPDTTVEENNLNHNISVLRKALGEKATGQQYIETVPRLGYRFVAPVETAGPDGPGAASVPDTEPHLPPPSWRQRNTADSRPWKRRKGQSTQLDRFGRTAPHSLGPKCTLRQIR